MKVSFENRNCTHFYHHLPFVDPKQSESSAVPPSARSEEAQETSCEVCWCRGWASACFLADVCELQTQFLSRLRDLHGGRNLVTIVWEPRRTHRLFLSPSTLTPTNIKCNLCLFVPWELEISQWNFVYYIKSLYNRAHNVRISHYYGTLFLKNHQLWRENSWHCPHNVACDTWVIGGNFPWTPSNHLSARIPRILRSICRYCCFLFNKLTKVMLPSCSPQRGQVAETWSTLRACQAWHSLPTSQMAGNLRRCLFQVQIFLYLSEYFPLCEREDFLITYP